MDPGDGQVGGVALALLGCGQTDYRPVDRLLELPGRVPDNSERVRVCVRESGSLAFGARFDGLYAVTGLPADMLDPLVTVEAITADGVLAQWQGVVDQDFVMGEQLDCLAPDEESQDTGLGSCVPCQSAGSFSSGEGAWVLGLRFSG
ncbi:MAG: hypothetical protein ACI9VR_001041 [Cognaticolwellia sp.]